MAAISSTKVLPCACTSAYQDKLYGKGNRLHNSGPKCGYRCTVCDAKRSA